MFTLVLVGALIAHSALAASLGNSYGSSPGYGSYGNDDASIGSRNGLGENGGRIENSVENGIGTSAFDGSNANSNADWITYRPNQPSHASLQYPTRPSANNLQDDRTQQAEQQLDVIHNMIATFVSNFNKPEGTPQYKNSLNAAINSINQKFSEISPQALQHESVRARFQKIKTYLETVVTSIRLRLDYIEEEQRLKAEREAERRRLEQAQSNNGGSTGVNQVTGINGGFEQGTGINGGVNQVTGINGGFNQGTGVNGGFNHGTGINGGVNQGPGINGGFNQGTGINGGYNPTSYQPPQSVPHPDFVAEAIRLQQNFNRLQNEVFQFNMFSMQFNYSNRDSILSEAQASAASLENSIGILSETSRRFQNVEIYNHTQELRKRLNTYLENLKVQASKYIPRYDPEDV